jgi:hypothetical protein
MEGWGESWDVVTGWTKLWTSDRQTHKNWLKNIDNRFRTIDLLTSHLATAKINKKINFDDKAIQNENYHFWTKIVQLFRNNRYHQCVDHEKIKIQKCWRSNWSNHPKVVNKKINQVCVVSKKESAVFHSAPIKNKLLDKGSFDPKTLGLPVRRSANWAIEAFLMSVAE